MARAAISRPIDVVSAASSDPTASAPIAKTKTRFLPILSPIRPKIGVKTEADSR